MKIYYNNEEISFTEASKIFGAILVHERLDESADWFRMHPHAEKVTWKDGMEIRKED